MLNVGNYGYNVIVVFTLSIWKPKLFTLLILLYETILLPFDMVVLKVLADWQTLQSLIKLQNI